VTTLVSAGYAFVTSGQKDSLLRYVISPEYDGYFTIVCSVIAFLTLIGLFFTRDRETFHFLVEAYYDQIKKLRAQGKTNPQIADMILKSVGSRPGSRHNLARRKLIDYLADLH
jgi:hypothetical protein